jgi:molecular chaperone HscB
MFVLRNWRSTIFVDRVLRPSRNYINSITGQPSETGMYIHAANARFPKLKYYSNTTFTEFKCWNCQTVSDTKPSLFCKTCTLIQSNEQQNFNYFELFNIDNQYDIDTEQLTSNFRQLQNLMHPDRFSNKTEVTFYNSNTFGCVLM